MSTMLCIWAAAWAVSLGAPGPPMQQAAPESPDSGVVAVEVLPPILPEFDLPALAPLAPKGSAAPVVAEFLSDPDPVRRLRGVEGIDASGTGIEIETLLAALCDEDARVRNAAAGRLSGTPPRALIAAVWESEQLRPEGFWGYFWRYIPEWRSSLGEPLRSYLERDDITGDQAALAAYALGLMRHEEAGPILARRAWVQHDSLAYRAAEALLRLGERGARADQAALLQHPLPGVRMMAVQSLGQFGGADAIHALHAAVLGQSERDLGVRQAAIGALARMEPQVVTPVLIDLMARVPGLNWEIRQALVAVTGLDNGRDPGIWRQWYEALQLYEAGEVEEANRRLEALQTLRSFRLR